MRRSRDGNPHSDRANAAIMKPKSDDTPTVDEYFKAAHILATTLRKAFDTKAVKRSRLEKVLRDFERVDFRAM